MKSIAASLQSGNENQKISWQESTGALSVKPIGGRSDITDSERLMRARHIRHTQRDARPAKSRLRGADRREVRTRIESPKGCRFTNAGPLKNHAVKSG
jgi:hypothetical protein